MAKTQALPALLAFDAAYAHPVSNALQVDAPSTCLVGIDEVGRGSWVGPVVAAAVCLPTQWLPSNHSGAKSKAPEWLASLNDSKKLTPATRAILAQHLMTHVPYGLGFASITDIETLNLHHASLLAAHNALLALLTQHTALPSMPMVLMDGKYGLPQWQGPQQAIIQGDAKSAHIAAASVVAKVYRDTLLAGWHGDYPHYGWAHNKGYGTALHRQAVEKHGPCSLHRPRFLRGVLPLPV
jgi:ribonuclease HII